MSQSISVAQYLANELSLNGQRMAFVLSGGAALHLIHAVNDHPDLTCIPLNHEFSAAAAADGFTRVAKSPAICIATSGPGATNLITGIAGAYYDSVPVIFLTGQVSRTRMLTTPSLRQYGFQQTPFVEIVGPITKAAFTLDDPLHAKRVLGEAVWTATEGRNGPVVIDIPDDVQRVLVNPSELETFIPPDPETWTRGGLDQFSALTQLLLESSRPVLVVGGGVPDDRMGQLSVLAKDLGAPIVRTWAASGLLVKDDPMNFGFFGTHGGRIANLIVQNADLVISIGCRLDTKATGSPATSFSRSAKKVVVDVDEAELNKFVDLGMNVDFPILMDAGKFLDQLEEIVPMSDSKIEWQGYCERLRTELGPEDFSDFERIGPSPVFLMSSLNILVPKDASVIVDTGLSLPFAMEHMGGSSERKIYHDFNNTAMGWSIGASVGAGLARPGKCVLTIVGDGSLALALGDLSSLSGNVSSSKVVLMDNGGHGMIRQTQNQWFEKSYVASSSKAGLHYPDWKTIAISTGYEYFELIENDISVIEKFVAAHGPSFLHVKLNDRWEFRPQVLFGYPNEDQDPPLARSLLAKLMKVPLTSASLESNRGNRR